MVEIVRPDSRNLAEVHAAAAATKDALQGDAMVVFQATFFDARDPAWQFLGYADFIVRRPDGRWRVQDTKLARHSKQYMQDQLALYHEQLVALGVPVDDTVEILLGDGTSVEHDIAELRAGLDERR